MQSSIVVIKYGIPISIALTIVMIGTNYKLFPISLQLRKHFSFTLLVYINFNRCLFTTTTKNPVNKESLMRPVQYRCDRFDANVGSHHMYSSLTLIQGFQPEPFFNTHSFSAPSISCIFNTVDCLVVRIPLHKNTPYEGIQIVQWGLAFHLLKNCKLFSFFPVHGTYL